jgi:hypothetical protein
MLRKRKRIILVIYSLVLAAFIHNSTINAKSRAYLSSTEVGGDVNKYINEYYTIEAQADAVNRFAIITQKTLEVNLKDKNAVSVLSYKGVKAISCIYARFDMTKGHKSPAIVIGDIESLIINTKEKALTYTAFNRALSGSVFSLPEKDSCES